MLDDSGCGAVLVDEAMIDRIGEAATRRVLRLGPKPSLGLEPGVRVAIVAPNTADYLEAYFALSLAGLIAVPIAYKCPKSVRFVSELPKSAAGKPLKHELRRSLSTGPGN